MEADVSEEQLLTVEFDAVRHADVTHRPAGARGTDCLRHRLLRANALQHRVRSNAAGQFLGARYAFITTLGNDVRRAKFARKLLPRRVTAHCDNALSSHLRGREDTQQADGAVAYDDDRRARLHVRRCCREPAGAQNVGGRQQARDQVVVGNLRGSHQCAVRERDAQYRRLRSAD